MKDSTVSARVENNVKIEAEEILQKLGVPVSVVTILFTVRSFITMEFHFH